MHLNCLLRVDYILSASSDVFVGVEFESYKVGMFLGLNHTKRGKRNAITEALMSVRPS